MTERSVSKKITINDLAEMAGVSKATVSRALNDSGEVSEQTKRRIYDLAEAVGYRMDSRARSLAGRRTETIGLVIPRTAHFIFGNPYFSQLIQGIGEQLDEAGYHLLLGSTPDPLAFTTLVRESRVDGLLITGGAITAEATDVVRALADQGFPLVVINEPPKRINCTAVTVDNAEGIWRAVNYLVEKGHKKIAFIASPQETVHGRERRRAFVDSLLEHGLDVPARLIETGDDTKAGGQAALGRLLDQKASFTAVIGSNDLMAIGAMLELHDRGVRVPDDVAVVGFDDIHLASLVRPALTTVRQPIARVGRVAANILVEHLKNPLYPLQNDHVRLSTELVIRQSA